MLALLVATARRAGLLVVKIFNGSIIICHNEAGGRFKPRQQKLLVVVGSSAVCPVSTDRALPPISRESPAVARDGIS